MILTAVFIKNCQNRNVIASSWTSSADASYLLINEDDRRFQLWQWFDRVLAVYLLNLCTVLLFWCFWRIIKLSHLLHKWRFIYVYLPELNTFMNCFVVSHIWIETYSRMKVLIEVERSHWDDQEDIKIFAEFHHEKSFCSVVLHVITVDSKFAFNVLIDSLWLIINLRMIDCE